MNGTYKLIISCLISAAVSLGSQASNPVGSDISWTLLDSGKVEITLRLYRDCRTLPLSTPTLSIKCLNGTQVKTVSVTRKSIKDLTLVCHSAKKTCDPVNYPASEGVEEHTFTGIVDLSSLNFNSMTSCCEYVVYYSNCCHPGSITTGSFSGAFNYAVINTCVPGGNSSPVFDSAPLSTTCCNQPVYYNIGARDTADGDSLSYALVCPAKDVKSDYSYSASFSCTRPLTVYDPTGRGITNPNTNPPIGMYMDPVTGQTVFTPVDCGEVTLIVTEVKEWRKDSTGRYALIGISRRENVLWVKSCPDNNPPVITAYSYSVCEGDPLEFVITSDDQVFRPPPPAPTPPLDTTRMDWNKGIAGAKFQLVDSSARLKVGLFSWTPPLGSAHSLPYQFTVRVWDNACPQNAIAYKALPIYVKPKTRAAISASQLSCNQYKTEVVTAGDSAELLITQSVLSASGEPIGNPNMARFLSSSSVKGNKAMDTIQFGMNGTFIIQATVRNKAKCDMLVYDTVRVEGVPEVLWGSKGDTLVCANDELLVKPVIREGQLPYKVLWHDTAVKDSIWLLGASMGADSSLSIRVTDANQCSTDWKMYVVNRPVPFVRIGKDRVHCQGDTIHLSIVDSIAWWDDPADEVFDPKPLQTKLTRKLTGLTLDNVPFSIEGWNHKAVDQGGWYTATVEDDKGCKVSDQMMLVTNRFEHNAGPDLTLCPGDSFTLFPNDFRLADSSGVFNVIWLDISNDIPQALSVEDTLKLKSTQTSQTIALVLSVTQFDLQCGASDTIRLQWHEGTDISLPASMAVCCNDPDLYLGDLAQPKGGTWSGSSPSEYVRGEHFVPALACNGQREKVYCIYAFTDSNACVWTDSFGVHLKQLPEIDLRDQMNCRELGLVLLKETLVVKPEDLSEGKQVWNCLNCAGVYDWDQILFNRSGDSANPVYALRIDSAHLPFSEKARELKVELWFEQHSTGCSNRDTVAVYVIRDLEFRWDQTNLCRYPNLLDLSTQTGIWPAGGNWELYDTLLDGILNPDDLRSAFSGGKYSADTLNAVRLPPAGGRVYMRYHHESTGCAFWGDTILTVWPLPEVQIDKTPLQTNTVQEPYLISSESAPILLYASPSGGLWGSDFSSTLLDGTFYPGNAPVDTVFNIFYTYSDAFSCTNGDTASILVYSVSGMGESARSDFSVHPNPVGMEEVLFVFGQPDRVLVWDINGRLIRDLDFSNSKTIFLTIPCNIFPSTGVYTLELHAGNRIQFVKQIVNRR